MNADRIADAVRRVGALDENAMAQARARQRSLTKPEGSLGRLEELAILVAGITGTARPRLRSKAVIVMAADHGVAARGVSAYPQAVTAQMVANFMSGGAAINAIATAVGARVVVVDVGVAGEIAKSDTLRRRRVSLGTRDLSRVPAMTRADAERAVVAGIEVIDEEAARGLDIVAIGDMGIGNTTAASAVVASICRALPVDVTGRGTGIDDEALMRKRAVVEEALARHQPDPDDALDVLTKVGGLEIGAIAGAVVAAASRRIPVVLDGFISTVAALIAAGLAPRVIPFLIAGHRSVEPGHRFALDHLCLVPLLDLGMRLGEGTGAALAMSVVDVALAVHDGMATFAEASVAGPIAERVVHEPQCINCHGSIDASRHARCDVCDGQLLCVECARAHYCTPGCLTAGCRAGGCVHEVNDGIVSARYGLGD